MSFLRMFAAGLRRSGVVVAALVALTTAAALRAAPSVSFSSVTTSYGPPTPNLLSSTFEHDLSSATPVTLTVLPSGFPNSTSEVNLANILYAFENGTLIAVQAAPAGTTPPGFPNGATADILYTPFSAGVKTLFVQASNGTATPSTLDQENFKTIQIKVYGVSISSPAAGAALPVGSDVFVSAPTLLRNGTVASVEFFADGVPIGSDTSFPYAVSWRPAAAGSVNLTAVMTDSAGTLSVSPAVAVTVIPATANGTISVAVTNPASGANVAAGSTVALSASASISNASARISQVQFYVDGVAQGVADPTFPYEASWTPVSAGNYAITAVATDDKNNTVSSSAVTVTVTGNVPSITIDRPLTGSSAVAGIPMVVTATATGPNGTATTSNNITSVDFFVDGNLIGSSTTAPFFTVWTPQAARASAYTLTARVNTPTAGSASSTPVSVTVVAAATPVVSFTQPDAGALLAVNAVTPLTATATVAGSSITGVQFYVDGVARGAAVVAYPYSTNWTPTSAGNYTLQAVATSANGLSATTTRTVTVTTDIASPTVTLSPAGPLSIPVGSAQALSANAVSFGGRSIQKVEFSVDGVVVATDTTSPYSTMIAGPSAGSHTVVARVTDSAGATGSAQLALETTAVVGSIPTVSLSAPLNGGTYNLGTAVTLAATAADADGTVARVDFFVNDALVGSDTTAPFTLEYVPVMSGSQTVRAIAYDDKGNSAAATATITIASTVATGPTVAVTKPTTGASAYTGQNYWLEATASSAASDAEIGQVEFFVDGISVGLAQRVAYTSTYRLSWAPSSARTYSIVARAVDTKGTPSLSAPAALSVSLPPGAPPTITLGTPTDGLVTTTTSTINLTAFANDSDGTIASVEFFMDYGRAAVAEVISTRPFTDQTILQVTGVRVVDGGAGYKTAPVVSFTGGGGSGLRATARITDGVVTGVTLDASGSGYRDDPVVAFLGGGLSVGESLGAGIQDTASSVWRLPYSFASRGAGPYRVYAVGRDNSGNSVRSAVANVTVAGATSLAPTVSLSANSTSVRTGQTLILTATPSDSDGSISRVDFYNGTTLIGTASGAPYTLTYTPVSTGTLNLVAVATDNTNNTAVSSAITVVVTASVPPTVTLTAPTAGASYPASSTVTVSASAADADGSVVRVEFLLDGTVVATDTTAPYAATVTLPSTPGLVSLAARAVDDGGSVGSAILQVRVVGTDVAPPTVTANPGTAFSMPAGARRVLQANATAYAGRSIVRVDLYQAGVKIAEDAVAPYSFLYTAPSVNGTYALEMRAVDSAGATGSAQVSVEVTTPVGQAPTVALQLPTLGTTVTVGGFVTFSATATDPDGSIQSVTFLVNNEIVGTFTAPPYSTLYYPTASGALTVTALALDGTGRTSSASTTITVLGQPQGTPSVVLTAPNSASATVVAGQRILFEALATAGTADSYVSQIEFLVNGRWIGTYGRQVGFSNLYRVDDVVITQPGTYVVTALVFDSRGVIVQSFNSQVISVKAPASSPPSVSIVSPTPTAGALALTTLSQVNLVAVASDAGGAVSEVEFFVDRGTRAKGTVTIGSETLGSGDNQTTRKFVQSIAVSEPGEGYLVLPRVAVIGDGSGAAAEATSFTNPARGVGNVDVLSGGSGYNNASALFIGGGLFEGESLGRAVKGADGLSWTLPFSPGQLGEGPYYVYAVARETDGNQTISSRLRVNVTGSLSRVPTVSVTASTLTPKVGLPVVLSASAADPDGSITQVEFFANGASLGVVTTAPYSLTWTPAVAGAFNLTAVATDNSGNVVRSTAVYVAVTANQVPTATVTSPLADSYVATGRATTITASAGDTDGTVAQVEFFANGTSIGVVTSAPYRVTWTPAAPGDYLLTAVATDNAGALSESSNGVRVFAAFEVRRSPLSDATEFINSLYSDFLARSPTDEETTAGVAALNAGTTTRAAMIDAIYQSSEYRVRRQTVFLFKAVLGVYPTPSELEAAITGAVDIGGTSSGVDAGSTPSAARAVSALNTSDSITIGDVDYFRFVVPSGLPRSVTIATTGGVDTTGELSQANADGSTTVLAQDDDSGQGFNFSITRVLSPGTYYVAVTGFSFFSIGDYTLQVSGLDLSNSGGGGATASATLSAIANGLLNSTTYKQKYGVLGDLAGTANEARRRTFVKQIYLNAYGSTPSALQEQQGQYGVDLVGAPAFLAAMTDGTSVNGIAGGFTSAPDMSASTRAAALLTALLRVRPTDALVATVRASATGVAAAQAVLNTVNYTNRFITVTTAPQSQTLSVGSTLRLTVDATGAQPMTYQWYQNGTPIAGATSQVLTVTNVQTSQAGLYSVAISNGLLSVFSPPAIIAVGANTTRLYGLSTRAPVGTGGGVLIAGFTITGTTAKTVLIRASGPALTGFGLAGAVVDPKLELYQGNAIIATNDNWGAASDVDVVAAAIAQVGLFSYQTTSKDAALVRTLSPGSYTAQVSGNGGSGLSLVEVYDVGSSNGSRTVALSTRGEVKAGSDNLMIGGFTIEGTASRRVMIRAVGPGLSRFGVTGVLGDPKLTLVNASGVTLATNNDWEAGNDATAVASLAAGVGLFALESGSKDAVLVTTLGPGAYTAKVEGADGGTGVALVEVYDLDR